MGSMVVVRIWQDLAKTAKMLVRGSTRNCTEQLLAIFDGFNSHLTLIAGMLAK